MSCSKIFSGDLPELTYDIIERFKNDFSTLHSCILVNRFWCHLTIPLLWENPFSIPTENYNFIEFYLNNLNNDLKSKLNEYKINDNLLPSKTLFNYPSFIKYLNTCNITFSIGKWFETLKPGSRYYLRDSDRHSVFGFEKLICMLLFKMFIENEVNLHIFEIEVTDYPRFNFYLDDILELMLRNPNFIYNIRELKLYIMINSSINHIKIRSIKNRITEMIINSHQILKKIVLGDRSIPLYQSLLLSNNCSNSLNIIVFCYIDFYGITNLDKVFEQLNVLESVHIVNCSSLNTFTRQIINSTKPFKLKTLLIREISQIESLQLLLQISGDYLENFGYVFVYEYDLFILFRQQLLELIIKYCKNIKFLELEADNQIIYLALDLIENINYLSIDICGSMFSIGECNSIILRNLGQKLPPKLEYLCLTLSINSNNTNDFETFLKNSQNTFINKLLIENIGRHNILSCIKEYIMKKKRVKHLAIMDNAFDEYEVDLFSLKDVVKEFELYNIVIQEYYNSKISLNNLSFVKELN